MISGRPTNPWLHLSLISATENILWTTSPSFYLIQASKYSSLHLFLKLKSLQKVRQGKTSKVEKEREVNNALALLWGLNTAYNVIKASELLKRLYNSPCLF